MSSIIEFFKEFLKEHLEEAEFLYTLFKWGRKIWSWFGWGHFSSLLNGLALSCLGFLGVYSPNEPPPDHQNALASLVVQAASKPICTCDEPDRVLMHMGKAYYDPRYGILADRQKGVCLFRCVANHPNSPFQGRAFNRLGFAYWNGKGVAQSFEEAFKLWKKGSELDDHFALTAYYSNCSNERASRGLCDLELARSFLDKAADMGHKQAIYIRKRLQKQSFEW